MNSNNKITMQKFVVIGQLILFILIPIVLISIGIYFDLFYIMLAACSVISFFIGVILLIRKKPFYFLITITIGILFLAHSVIEYQFNKFSGTLTIDEQIEFSRILRPERVGHGLSNVAVGMAYIILNILMIKKDGRKIREGNNVIYLIMICLGILYIWLGINNILHGLQIL